MPSIITAESVMGDGSSVQNQMGQCAPLLSPVIGSFIVIAGDGTSVGTVIRLQCPSRHRVVSGSQMSCVWSSNNTHWSGGIPECKPLTRLEDKGFQLALLLSFISIVIIIFMSIIYITSCLVRHVRHEERRKMERMRKREEATFWQQMDGDGLDLTGEVFHSQKIRNNNNNNNNNSIREERQHMETTITTDNQIFSHDDLVPSAGNCLYSIHSALSLRTPLSIDNQTDINYLSPLKTILSTQ
nr:sushi domain-containing protein 3 [Misgurnus anguillicaudatus]